MRDFIKKQIQERMNIASKNNEPESVPNEAILEYASLFQELDDLSEEGNQAGKVRKLGMEYGLDMDVDDDDTEIETVEFNLGDGNVNVRKDVASVTESYTGIKSYEEFYQEATEAIVRMPREFDDAYKARVTAYADKLYNEYCEENAACGYYGFDKINIADNSVPSKLMVNFGPIAEGSNDNYVAKVNAFFATDKDHNLSKKQLDSVDLVRMGALKKIGEPLKAYMESAHTVPKDISVWEICTPKSIIVPKGNSDSFCVVVEYTNEITGKNEYFGWTAPVSEDESINMESCEKFNMESFVNEDHYENHARFIQEQAELDRIERLTRRVRPSRFFQEAIEGLDESTSTDTSTEAAPAEETSTEEAPASESDVSADGTTTDEKSTAAVNDVSGEIADKVATDTQNDAMSSEENITFSDETNPTDNVGVADVGDVDETTVEGDDAAVADEEANIDDADAALDELDDVSSAAADDAEGIEDEEDVEALGTGDIDNMSVNQLLELGKESLKDMTVADLKNLISKNDNEAIQEAFILTSKNINKELDIKLRRCLGILNNADMKAEKLLGKFKLEGHKLNRVLSKAAKMTKVYSSDEIASIKKLNTALVELLTSLKKNPENYASAIKDKIKAFTKESKVVGNILDDKLNSEKAEDKVTQEAFLLSNINDKITKALIPVKADMVDISEKYQAGQLTRGRIIKKYSSTNNNPGEDGTVIRTSHMTRASDLTITGYNKNAKKIDDALKLLNKAIRKNADKIELITQLADKIDIISDYIETVIDDKTENKEYISMIGKMAGEIVELINQFIGDNTSNITPDEKSSIAPTYDSTMDTAPVSDDDEENAIEIPEEDEGILEEPDDDEKEDEE